MRASEDDGTASPPPATPRDAASVLLLRGGATGVQVFLLRRVRAMTFAGGMTAFPGGGVDPGDSRRPTAWTGPPPSWWGERLGCPTDLAGALVCTAVRETFEETGVLLAGWPGGAVVDDTAPFAAARQALVDRTLTLADFLADAGLVLRADLLRPWAHWITPVSEPRRYDTRFFAAELPAGQRGDGHTTEADQVGWRRPVDALADWQDGRLAMLTPTHTMLTELATQPSVTAALTEPRDIHPILPRIVRDATGVRVLLPGQPGYRLDGPVGGPARWERP